jgi:predicted enzyme related to lactoylglutathione lyase
LPDSQKPSAFALGILVALASIMNTHHAGAVIYAKDQKRVAAFYEHVASMRECHADSHYIELESNAFQLVVLQIPEHIADTIVIASPPSRREDGAIKLVLFVQSIAHARASAVQFGGSLNLQEREWQFQGATVCDGYDPEGNVFQLRQRQNAER